MRVLAPVLSLGLLSFAPSAWASPDYPAQVESQLMLKCDGGLPVSPCPCELCHVDDSCQGGMGTANRPFAQNMKSFGLQGEMIGSLDTALADMASHRVSSAEHCFDDIDTLKVCQNPNVAASLSAPYCPHDAGADAHDDAAVLAFDAGPTTPPLVTVPVSSPSFGCVGRIAPSAPSVGVPAGLLGLAVGFVAAFRRRRR